MRRLLVLVAVLGLCLGVPAAFAQEAPPTTSAATATTLGGPPTTAAPEAGRGGVPPPPVLVVEPDSGLVDGQTVTLSGTGWNGPVDHHVRLCRAEIGDPSVNCTTVGTADADLQGNLSGTATLPVSFTPRNGPPVDCLAEPCVVAVFITRGDAGVAPVSFLAGVIPATPAFTG
jgi:hypothetical protein